MTPQAQYPYPLPLQNPMWSNQGTGSNADGSAQVNLGGMTLAWMGVFQDIVALCRVTLIVETLTQDYDVAPPTAPANGQLLAVILTQDSIGGHTVTWDSMNQTMLYAPTANSAAEGVTVALFVGSGGYWWYFPYPVAGGGGGGGNPAPIVQLLTGPYNVVPPTAVDGQVLLVRLTQDATGARAVTWDSSGNTFKFPPEIILSAGNPNMTTTAIFVASGGFWWGNAIGRHA